MDCEEPPLIPLYGFLRGDMLGLVVLARGNDTIAQVAQTLQDAATLRVQPYARVSVLWQGRRLEPDITVSRAGLAPLD